MKIVMSFVWLWFSLDVYYLIVWVIGWDYLHIFWFGILSVCLNQNSPLLTLFTFCSWLTISLKCWSCIIPLRPQLFKWLFRAVMLIWIFFLGQRAIPAKLVYKVKILLWLLIPRYPQLLSWAVLVHCESLAHLFRADQASGTFDFKI